MKAVIQRVNSASVKVEGRVIAKIRRGLVLLIGINSGDTDKDIAIMSDKIFNMRIFDDNKGKMNLSIKDTAGEILVISQFTLLADLYNGRRPSFTEAAPPDDAEIIYNQLVCNLKKIISKVECGMFRTHMQLELVNDGPATFIFDTNKN